MPIWAGVVKFAPEGAGFFELRAILSKTVPSQGCRLPTVRLDASTPFETSARRRVQPSRTAGRHRDHRAADRDPDAGAREGEGTCAEPAVFVEPPLGRPEPPDLREPVQWASAAAPVRR